MSESHRFLEVGHVRERTTKTGNPYLTGMVGGQQVFLFLQEDGSWKVSIRADEPSLPAVAGVHDRPIDQKAYEQTLAGVKVPDYDEPLRRRSLRERAPSPSATRKEPGGTTARRSSGTEHG